jgi:hypothetical protein
MKYSSKSKSILKKFKNIRISKDYPWHILNTLRQDLAQFIPESDNERLTQIIRARSLELYFQLSDDWGLQSMCLSGACISELRAKYQLSALLKKFIFPDKNDACESCAIDTFVASEVTCAEYNREGYTDLIRGVDNETLLAYTYAQGFIQKVIGFKPDFKEVNLWSRHGPGASLDTEKGKVSHYFKYENYPYSVTSRAFGHAVTMITQDERWRNALEGDYREKELKEIGSITSITSPLNQRKFWHSVLKFVDGNRITTVPKSYKTHRTIAIEPPINLMLQLGVDGFIRRRLKRWDVNLDSQEKNRKAARQGSIHGDLATLDLKAASDTISKRICELLLPTDWYDYLLDLRSPVGAYRNEKFFSFEKISSMGNGYTFALESLIFSSIVYGALKAVGREQEFKTCCIYGDDIIIPTDMVSSTVSLLNKAGFALNLDKSYITGPVRESCGADWFHGVSVRPIHISETPTNVKQLFNHYNLVRKVLSSYWTIEGSKCLEFIMSHIPVEFRNFIGPVSDNETDTYLHSEFAYNKRYSNGVWKFDRLVYLPVKVSANNFHFRKLMHPLRGSDLSEYEGWHELHMQQGAIPSTNGTGSRFDVGMRNYARVAIKPSVASNWQSEYTTPITSKDLKYLSF